MKTLYILASVMALFLFSSFTEREACEYVGSNIGFIKSQTEKAIDAEDLNRTRFLIYQALKAIYKSQDQLKDCGCGIAAINIEESEHHLKLAVKATSINGAKILLSEALSKTLAGLEALSKHHLHEKQDTSKDLAMNNVESEVELVSLKVEELDNNILHRMIDDSLLDYETSLAKVINTVPCKDALAYANKIFQHCEQELLNSDLSEGKKYYNLRTQEITAKAIKRLGNCEPSETK